MNYFMTGYVSMVLGAILVALLGYLGIKAKQLYTRYINTEMKQNICRTVVRFVEQVYQDLHGPDKLREAMHHASDWLEAYGITITDDELISMIEAAVNEFNGNFNKKQVKA